MNRVVCALSAVALVLVACGDGDTAAEVAAPEQAVPVSGAQPEEPEPGDPETEPGSEGGRQRSVLTGEALDDDVIERPLMIVKIENSPQSRPQSGLEAADVVIEEVVEAGVTRFMGFFQSDIPRAVGPTRSARPVDAQLIASFGRSGFVYSGARPEVRGLLGDTPAIQISEGGAGFYRLADRRAPHNLYNRLPQALAAVRQRDPEVLKATGWVFDEDPPPGAVRCAAERPGCDDPGTAIDIAMSREYRTGWVYDPADGLYRRSQDGEPFYVTGPDTIGAANVVVLATHHYLGEPNCYGARCPETDVTTDGARAIVLRDGERYEVSWHKPTASAHIELRDEHGDPFPLKPGPSWIHLPPAANLPAPSG